MDVLSTCPYLGHLEGEDSRVFDKISKDFSSVQESFLFYVASWSKTDRSLSCYSLESFRCNFKAILLSHENVPQLFILMKFLLLIKKKNETPFHQKSTAYAIQFCWNHFI